MDLCSLCVSHPALTGHSRRHQGDRLGAGAVGWGWGWGVATRFY